MVITLDQLQTSLQAAKNYIDETAESTIQLIADEFSTSKSYNVGDYISYNGALYKFTTSHAAGSFNPSHVEEVTIVDELGNVIENLDKKADTLIKSTSAGKIASFDDGEDGALIKELTVDINPVQDLHGYENPWPGGNGKNLVDFAGPATITTETVLTNYETTEETTFTVSAHIKNNTSIGVRLRARVLNGSATVADNVVYIQDQEESDISKTFSTTGLTFTKIQIIVNGASAGYSCEVSKVQLEKGSSATTFEPYSNICPITGFDGVNVVRTGKNLYNPDTKTVNGLNTYNEIKVAKDTQYTFSVDILQSGLYIDGKSGESWVTSFSYHYDVTSITFNSGDYTQIRVRTYGSPLPTKFQLELGSTATAYEPYQGITYPITFPQEAGIVCGGTLDVVSGVLTVDRVYTHATWGDGLYGTVLGSNTRKLFTCSEASIYPNWTKGNPICNIAPYKARYEEDSIHFYVNANASDNILVYLPNDTNDETVIEVVYELATPQVYYLTPVEIRQLLGHNNIWVDCNNTNINVKYYSADISSALDTKADKIPASASDVGKSLTVGTVSDGRVSSWEFFDAATKQYVDTGLAGKVSTVSGKGLSTNDYTTAEKNKLSGIEIEANKTTIDSTLSITGNAADAKATGDAINDLAEVVDSKELINSASGSIVSFDDGADDLPVKKMIVDIEPKQDLHGYDHPWPAGGGKNLLNANSTNAYMSLSNGVYTVTSVPSSNISGLIGRITLKSGVSYILSGGYSNALRMIITVNGTVYMSGSTESSVFTPSEDVTANVSYVIETGASVGWKIYPMIRLATVTDSTFAPYSNICPITGWTGIDVTRTGVNIWDEEWETGTYSDATGEKTSYSTYIRCKNAIAVAPLTNYGLTVSPGGFWIGYYDINNEYITYSNVSSSGVFTTPYNAYYVRFHCYNGYGNTYNNNLSINYPSTDHDYHSYSGTTYSITFPTEAGTVYGGSLDVTTGVLTVNKAMVDLGTLTWTSRSSFAQGLFSADGLDNKDGNIQKIICSTYQYKGSIGAVSSATNYGDKTLTSYQSGGYVYIYDTAYSDADATAFKAAMDGVQLVYELATPITYQLTPTEVTTLLGYNNIWSDTGDSEVTYYTSHFGEAIKPFSDKIENKVDKISGKGLSTEDYTTAEKTKLSGIETGAQVNTVTSVATKTGAVILDGGDVSYSNSSTYSNGTVGNELKHLKSHIDDLEEGEQNYRFGVAGIGQSAAALRRIWDSIGMTAQVGTDGNNDSVVNDFDNFAPFNRRKCVGDWSLVNGKAVFTVNAYLGDADYAEDGTMGDFVAVECPRAYYYFDNGILGVSAHQYPEWRPFDIFCHNHDVDDTMEYYYKNAYALALKDGKAVSLPGYDNEQGGYKELLDRARTYKDGALGTNAILMPVAYNFYEWALYTVEFATQNCQSIMQGCAGLRHNNDDRLTFVDSTHVLVQNYYATRVAGEYIAIIPTNVDINTASYKATHKIVTAIRCDSSGTASSSGTYQLLELQDLGKNYWTYDATGVTEYRIAARPYRTGECNGVSTPSGSPVSNTDSYHPCKYRWHENPFSNQFKTSMDLFNTRLGTGDSDYYLDWYYLPDPTVYTPSSTSKPDATDLASNNFVKLDVGTAHENYVNGYIKSKKYSENYPDIWISHETTGGGASTYFCDSASLVHSNSVRACRFGGNWTHGAFAGFSYLSGNTAPSYSNAYYGGDLCFDQ